MKVEFDGQVFEVAAEATLLEAAEAHGIEIPTMCHLEGETPFTSCMMCVVWDVERERLVPACSEPAADGMRIETKNEKVRASRKDTLELLLSEHVGDCFAPCKRICPAHMDIPKMMDEIVEGDFASAIETVKTDIALPAVLGRICSAMCENGCRRSDLDQATSICMLKRFVADQDLESRFPYVPPKAKATGKKVAVVGSGPAGLAAAYHVLVFGHECVVFDDHEKPGGAMQYEVPEAELPRVVLDGEIDVITRLGMEFRGNTRVGKDVSMDELRNDFDAIMIGTGEISKEAAESFGLEYSRKGIKVNAKTGQTSDAMIFAAGDSVHPRRISVHSVAQGKIAAHSIHQFLNGQPITGEDERFDSKIGKMTRPEIEELLKLASEIPTIKAKGGYAEGYTLAEAQSEADRCLRCSCEAQEDCKLREYTDEYGANAKRFAQLEKAAMKRIVDGNLVFEPGKCTRCGICVRVARQRGEPLGLAFIGRSDELEVAVPLDETLTQALQNCAKEAAENCPTGALELRENGERES